MQRSVYVVPPLESSDRFHYWVLLSSAHGLAHSNAKWQNQADRVIHELELKQVNFFSQLLFKLRDGKIIFVVAKIVDDLQAGGIDSAVMSFINEFKKKYTL